MVTAGRLQQALDLLGRVLQQRGLTYDLVAIGGSGLLLLGIIKRPTQDLDVVALVQQGHLVRADPLPEPLEAAAHDVAATLGLRDDWIDPRPTSLLDFGLPAGFADRVTIRTFGALVIHLASRLDQIHFKVYAATDQGRSSRHFDDLRALAPTRDELLQAARWARTQDPSEAFHGELIGLMQTLGVGDASNAV
jgi:hypothetical protein